MIQPQVLLDTDTVSLLLRNERSVLSQARQHRATYGLLNISIITRYEVLKGLKFKGAPTQLLRFEQFCSSNQVLPLTHTIVDYAADIHGELRKRVIPIGDQDVLIAATALVHGLVVITNNTRHFNRITGLQIDNWLT